MRRVVGFEVTTRLLRRAASAHSRGDKNQTPEIREVDAGASAQIYVTPVRARTCAHLGYSRYAANQQGLPRSPTKGPLDLIEHLAHCGSDASEPRR